MRILIAEDDRKVASFIRQGLEEEGHAVDVAADGDTALGFARATRRRWCDRDRIVGREMRRPMRSPPCRRSTRLPGVSCPAIPVRPRAYSSH